MIPPTIADLDARGFRAIKKKFPHSNLEKQIQGKNSKLLSSCRPTITLDPLLWLQIMLKQKHSSSTGKRDVQTTTAKQLQKDYQYSIRKATTFTFSKIEVFK